MKRSITYIALVLTLITGLSLLFISADDVTKAKLSLKVLGIHKHNQEAFGNISALLLANNYGKMSSLEEIDARTIRMIEHYLNSGTSKQVSISDVYAFNDDRWNAGCTPSGNLPDKKFEYLLRSDKAIIICATSGGLVTSPWFEFFEVNKAGELALVNEVNSSSSNLFDLALVLRFDEDKIGMLNAESIELPVQ